MKFLLIIGHYELYVYRKDANRYIPKYIEGEGAYKLSSDHPKRDVEFFLDSLLNETNLESISDLSFDVLKSPVGELNTLVLSSLEKYIENEVDLETVLIECINHLSKDATLCIKDYGVNYQGYSYNLENNKLSKKSFSLLSYYLECNDVVKYV